MTQTHKNALARIRRTSGFTQAQVAGYLGVSKATYSSWETGRAELGAERIIALSEFFDCTPSDILDFPRSDRSYSFLSESEEEFLSLVRSLPPNIRKDIVDIMQTTVKRGRLH